jgi:hypothetical protein
MAKLATSKGDLAFIAIQAGLPMSELFTWSTDVFPAWNGVEDRIQCMPNPTRKIKLAQSTDIARERDAYNTAFGGQTSKWAVPLWAESAYVGDVAAGATTLPLGNTLMGFRSGGLALLWSLTGAYRVLELSAVTGSSITFPALPADVAAAYVMPLYVGTPDDPISRAAAGSGADWSFNFLLDDDPDDTPTVPAQFLGQDLYLEPTLLNGNSLSDSLKGGFQTISYGLGPSFRSTPWSHSQRTRPLNVMTAGLSAMVDFRKWLMRRSGKYRAFWHPTFESDFELVNTGAMTNQITVKDQGWSDWAQQRTHLALYYSGAWHPFTITAATPNAGDRTVLLQLDGSLGGIGREAVTCVSYLGLWRLDTDSVTLNWVGNAVAQTAMTVLELAP